LAQSQQISIALLPQALTPLGLRPGAALVETVLEAMEQQFRNLGFTVQQYRAPKAAE